MKKTIFSGTLIIFICVLCGCSSLGGKRNNNSSSADSDQYIVMWPSSSDWTNCGLRNLRTLKQPPMTTVTSVALLQGIFYIYLEDAGREAYDNLVSQVKKITRVRAPFSMINDRNGELIEYMYGNHIISLAGDFINKELVIRIVIGS